MNPPLPGAAVLLDRDGTIIEERHYLHDPDGVVLLPGALEGLRRLQAKGYPLVVLTNQSGVGRGWFEMAAVDAVHRRLEALLGAGGVHLSGIHVCPHRPEEGCGCRKPAPGLAEAAARVLGLVPGRCVMVGDNRCDVDLARAWGCRSILVRTGHGAAVAADPACAADEVVADLHEAAWRIPALLGGRVPAPGR